MSADENGPLPDLSALASSGIAKVTIAGQDFIPASHLAEALNDVKRLRGLLAAADVLTEAQVRGAVLAILRHEGYDTAELDTAEATNHAPRCSFDGAGWDCTDDDGKSLHPLSDRMYQLAEEAQIAHAAIDEIRREAGLA